MENTHGIITVHKMYETYIYNCIYIKKYSYKTFSTLILGYWLLHSQLSHHQSQGMSLIIQEGDLSIMTMTPPNFPTCGSFESSKEDIEKAINDQKKLGASQPMQHCGSVLYINR